MPFRLLQLLLQQVVLTSLTTEHANPQEHPYYDIGFHKANVLLFEITKEENKNFPSKLFILFIKSLVLQNRLPENVQYAYLYTYKERFSYKKCE